MMKKTTWKLRTFLLIGLFGLFGAGAGHAASAGGAPNPFPMILLLMSVLFLTALLGRWAAAKFNQPAVLGELIIGVIIGNIGYWLYKPLFILLMHTSELAPGFADLWRQGYSISDATSKVLPVINANQNELQSIEALLTGPRGVATLFTIISLWFFSNLGIVLLLFMVGLESSVSTMMRVGKSATMVALIGMAAPFGLGYLMSYLVLPDASAPVHIFISAILCATSIGITARVFKDMGNIKSREAQTILGAAVIDDVLGLIVLAVAVGIVSKGHFMVWDAIKILLISFAFLGILLFIGDRLAHMKVKLFKLLDPTNVYILSPLTFAFVLSYLADAIGLAMIVGAFAAGLILTEEHFNGDPKSRLVEQAVAPLEAVFAPIFFVLMGMQVNLATFANAQTLLMGGLFIVAAIIGKVAAGLAAGKGSNKLIVGIGMVPRGEVGLIFASIGKTLGVVTDGIFSAVVLMVIVTTFITPPALKFLQQRKAALKA